MANFEFDLEQAEQALDNVEDLFSVFWGFFVEERPFGEKVLWDRDQDIFHA